MLNNVIGSRIRSCRQNNTLTQEQLAEKICVSHQTISKWENGLALPDVSILTTLSVMFHVSMDYLCGTGIGEQEKVINEIIKEADYTSKKDFNDLKLMNLDITEKLKQFPFNDTLLDHQLHTLRKLHDTANDDEQKEYANDLISLCAEKILDVSKNDLFRSYANYNMAIYFDEQPQESNTLEKAREYADKVLFKDMYPGFFNIIGKITDSDEYVSMLHKTINDGIKTVKSGMRNLARYYRRKGDEGKYENLMKKQENMNVDCTKDLGSTLSNA